MDDSSARIISVICGPTASGKTSVAVKLAEAMPLAIVSADSRQLYRGFDIGTAKPSAEIRQLVPHAGVDVLDPTVRASAAWWGNEADDWIRDGMAAGRTPLVVGGTGLYLRAVFGELFEQPPMDETRRRALQSMLDTMATDELRRWVTTLDPSRSHLGRAQLLRALEIALLTGQRVSELHRERARPPRWRARYLLVDPGAALADRIAVRTDDMLSGGWIEEVSSLIESVPADAPAWNASGYGVVRELVQGTIHRDAARQRIVIATRQYAKRQRTWFRHQLDGDNVTLLDTQAPDWASRAMRWFAAGDVA